MKYSNETMMGFYKQLGKIFYAVAAADQVISKEELATLRQVVRSEWLSFDSSFDEFGTDSAYQIEIVFDWLEDNKWDANRLIPSFREFKKLHPSLFTKDVNDLILKTANLISEALGRKDTELAVLNEVERELNTS